MNDPVNAWMQNTFFFSSELFVKVNGLLIEVQVLQFLLACNFRLLNLYYQLDLA